MGGLVWKQIFYSVKGRLVFVIIVIVVVIVIVDVIVDVIVIVIVDHRRSSSIIVVKVVS